MKITPTNGFMLVEPCDSPFVEGLLKVPRENMPVQWGRVVAESAKKLHVVPGDIVFFLADAAQPIAVDNDEMNVLVNETVVLAQIPQMECAVVKSKSIKPTQETPKPNILVPGIVT